MENKNQHIDQSSLKENKGGFKMPENYLDNFEATILNKISEEELVEKEIVKIDFKKWLYLSIPVAAALIIGLFVIFGETNIDDDAVILEENELMWDQYAMFDESWIVDELAELSLSENQTTNEEDEWMEEDIDFLLAQGITELEIINEIKELP